MALILELLEQLPLEDLERVDTACDAFVSAWRRDETPRIEDFVAAAPESLQRLLALELIRTEVELRRAAGERLSSSDYEVRFPQWAHEVQTVVAELLVAESLSSLENTEQLWARDTDASGEFRMPSAVPVPATSSKSEVNYDYDGLPTDRRLGNYQIQDILGRGGMGIVVRARDIKLEREVAIKLLAPEVTRHDVAKQRFLREARAAAAVRHDNVVTIHAVDEAVGVPFLVMELIHGESLSERIRRDSPLPAIEVARIALQVALGLEAAHKRGLIHRDIKPANILLERAEEQGLRGKGEDRDASSARPSPLSPQPSAFRAKITDFGLARVNAEATITRVGIIAGTPQYMSPEQALGQPVDHRSDLFSLGSVMYSMCTGRAAFQAETTFVILRQVTEDTPPPIADVNRDIPVWLSAVINKLMAKRPEDRFQTAAEVAEALRKNMPDRRTGILSRPEEKRRARIRQRTITALVGFAALIALAVFVIRNGSSEFELTTDDPKITARIDEQGGIVVEDRETKQPYTLKRGMNRLPTGDYDLVVTTPEGLELDTPKFQIKRGKTVAATIIARGAKATVPEKAAAPSELAKAAATDDGTWIDVLPLIDPARDRVQADHLGDGRWQLEGGELVLTKPDNKPAKLLLPLRVLGKSLELEIEFTRATDEPGTIIPQFPVPDGTISVRVDGNRHWTSFLLKDKPTRVVSELNRLRGVMKVQTGQRHVLRCRLSRADERDRMDVAFDQQAVDAWTGDIATLKEPPKSGDPANERIGLFVTKSDFVFHKIRVRMLDDVAEPIPPPSEKPSTNPDFALEFPADGTGRVEIPTLTWDGTPSLTIEARVSTTFPQSSPMIIARVQGSAYAQLYCFGPSDSKKARWAGLAGIGRDNYSAIMAAEISPEMKGQVAHVAVVINASAVRIFENGKLLSEKSHSVSQFSGKRPSGTSLGAEFDDKTKRWVYAFPGRLDEVRISKIPRYSQNFTPEVRFNSDADTLALYHCDEGQGETLTDASGNKHHGKIVGAKWIPTREHTGDVEPAQPVVLQLTPSELLASPDYEWSPPEAVPGLASTGVELGPRLAADGLSLWFHGYQDRAAKTGRLILWQAWRHELNQPFVKPVPVEDSVNELPGTNLTDATLSADGLLMAFCGSSAKDGSGADVWLSSRPSGDASWSVPISAGVAINSPAGDWEPELSSDGLELFFHSDRSNDHGGTDLWISRRSSRDEQFGTPQNLGAEINRLDHEGGAALSSDGLTLVFHRVSATSGEGSLWQTTRHAVGEPFGSPRPLLVPGLSGRRATSPSLSSAADQLLISTSNPSAGIAVSRRLPKRNAPPK